MNLITCPEHPGLVIENHPCPRCGHPQRLPEGREPYKHPWAKESQKEGTVGPVEELQSSGEGLGRATIQFADGTEVPFGHIDQETGEFVGDHPLLRQPTLDPTIFPAIERRQVPMVKLGFSGTVEMTQGEWESYCDQGLEPGRVVTLTMTGYLPDPHAKWVKRSEKDELGDKNTWWEQEGQVKVKALELGSFELRGFYDGE